MLQPCNIARGFSVAAVMLALLRSDQTKFVYWASTHERREARVGVLPVHPRYAESGVHTGTLIIGDAEIEYIVRRSAPTRWSAIGLVEVPKLSGARWLPRCVVVESGETLEAALEALKTSIASQRLDDAYVCDWAD